MRRQLRRLCIALAAAVGGGLHVSPASQEAAQGLSLDPGIVRASARQVLAQPTGPDGEGADDLDWEDSSALNSLFQESLALIRMPETRTDAAEVVLLRNASVDSEEADATASGAVAGDSLEAAVVAGSQLSTPESREMRNFLKDVLAIGQTASNSLAAELARGSAAASPSSLVRQLAAESAELLEEVRVIRAQSAAFGGQIGPAHAYPLLHVATRVGHHRSHGGGVKDWPEDMNQAFGMSSPVAQPPAMGTVRLMLVTFSLCLVLLSMFAMAQRRTMPMPKTQPFVLTPRNGWEAIAANELHLVEVPAANKALSVWDGTVATFSCIIGTGLLAMPYAFSLAGLIAAPVMIFFVSCSAYSAHLMAWQLNFQARRFPGFDADPEHQGWGFLVEKAFGPRSKHAINAFLIVELWGYMLSSTVCTALNVAQVFEQLDVGAAVMLSAIGAYALTFAPVKTLTRVNVLSNLVFVMCCVMYILTGLLLPTKAPASDIQLMKPRGFLAAAGILVFSPAGHSFYPALMQRMEEPEKFPVCVRRAYFAACILYLVVALTGYYLFGNAAQPSAVANIGVDLHLMPLPDLGWMNTVAAVGMAVKMLSMQVLVLLPLCSTIQAVLSKRLSEQTLNASVTPVVLLISAMVAVRFANSMARLLNLLGSVFCMNIAFVMPVLCYWKLSSEPVGSVQRAAFVGLVLMGSTFAILGLISCF